MQQRKCSKCFGEPHKLNALLLYAECYLKSSVMSHECRCIVYSRVTLVHFDLDFAVYLIAGLAGFDTCLPCECADEL